MATRQKPFRKGPPVRHDEGAPKVQVPSRGKPSKPPTEGTKPTSTKPSKK